MTDFMTHIHRNSIGHTIHAELPSGFALATPSQTEEYLNSGIVSGCSKAIYVGNSEVYHLAVRLRPPRRLDEIRSRLGREVAMDSGPSGAIWYRDQYNAGWTAGARESSPLWDSGMSNHAWDDGYLDRAAGRAKWHTTYCANHDDCGEG